MLYVGAEGADVYGAGQVDFQSFAGVDFGLRGSDGDGFVGESVYLNRVASDVLLAAGVFESEFSEFYVAVEVSGGEGGVAVVGGAGGAQVDNGGQLGRYGGGLAGDA